MSFFDPHPHETLPLTQWPWPMPSPQQQCDHCYCLNADVKSHREPHNVCCKCADMRARRFVGIDGRAVGKA